MHPGKPAPTSGLKPYFLSKWKCPFHGHFSARTEKPVDPKRPISCPECVIGIEFVSTLKGMTSQTIPYISKPRIPKKTDLAPIASEKAPLRKRGVNW